MTHIFALPNGTPSAPLTWAHGNKVFSRKHNKLVPQPEYMPANHTEARELAKLAKWLPSSISIPEGTPKDQRDQLKAAIPLWFPGGLKKKGADGGDSCRRRAVNMAPTKMVVFDLDECSPRIYNGLTMASLESYSAISYTTPSDTPEARRVRLVIELDRHVLSGKDGKGLVSSLVMQEIMESLNATPVADERGVWLVAGERAAFDMSVHDAEQYLIRPHKESEVKLYHGDPVNLDKLAILQWQPEVEAWGITGKKDSSEKEQREYDPAEWEKLSAGAKDLMGFVTAIGGVQVSASTVNIPCPNCAGHSDPGEAVNGSTVMKMPTDAYPRPTFHCSHSHCQDLNSKQALAFILMKAPPVTVPEVNKALSADEIQGLVSVSREAAEFASTGMELVKEWQREGHGVSFHDWKVDRAAKTANMFDDDAYWRSLTLTADYTFEDEPEIPADDFDDEPEDDYAPDAPPAPKTGPRGFAGLKAAMKADHDISSFIVDQIIPHRSVGFLYGDSMTKKTFMALHMSLSVATGTHFAGLGVSQGEVFYFAPEDFDGAYERYLAWCEHYNSGKPVESFTITSQRLPLEDEKAIKALVAATAKSIEAGEIPPIKLMVVDTFASNNSGAKDVLEENNGSHMGKVMSGAQLLASGLNCSVMMIHHVGVPDQKTRKVLDRMRGSSAMRAGASYLMLLEQAGKDVKFRVMKAKGVDRLPPRLFKTELAALPTKLVEAKRAASQGLSEVPHAVAADPAAWKTTAYDSTLVFKNQVFAENEEPEEKPQVTQDGELLARLLTKMAGDQQMLKKELLAEARSIWPEKFKDSGKDPETGKYHTKNTNRLNNAFKKAVELKLISESGPHVIYGAATARLEGIRDAKPMDTDWTSKEGEQEDF